MLSKRLPATFSAHCRLSYTEISRGKLLEVASILNATMPVNIANKLYLGVSALLFLISPLQGAQSDV